MCGIAGFWQTRPTKTDPIEILMRMGGALAHRGPDDDGIHFDGASGIGLAHRRLSVLDLSCEGRQPMRSASGRYTIVYNGEIYNHKEIRREIGHASWRGRSDTEVLLEAIEMWGLCGALRRSVGMFAFALWDSKNRKLHLVRDRLGIKPLYYGFAGEDFIFGSELKALRPYPGFRATIATDALALYMRHNCVPAPHSIYEHIFKLQPGRILTVGERTCEPAMEEYWSATRAAKEGLEAPITGSEAEILEELEQRIREAVRLRMTADVPIGTFLSGGIDSTLVTALMQRESGKPVKSFTIGFAEDAYNEAAYARKIAKYLGTDHTELYVSPKEALEVIPLLAQMYDEPFSDASQVPTYLLCKLARTQVTVSLSGDGGDELFGGYNRYVMGPRIWQWSRRIPEVVRQLAAGGIRSLPPRAIDRLGKIIEPVLTPNTRVKRLGDKAHKFARILEKPSRDAIYLQSLSHWDSEGVVQGSRDPLTVWRAIKELDSGLAFEEWMMLADLKHYLPDDILTKVDRASMAVSLEDRVPLLDHRVAELAWRLPLKLKIRDGKGKWPLRKLVERYIPPELTNRPKMGFAMPIGQWLRGPLRAWAEELLAPTRLMEGGLLNPKPVQEKWREHLSGEADWQDLLWDVLIFQDWRLRTGDVS